MVPARRLQELGQQVEARRLAGPVRPDQRMNAAAADLESDVANGEETREFLGQSVGFENELIGQTNFPLPARDLASRAFVPTGKSPEGRPSEAVRNLPPPGRNMPSTAGIRQGGKLRQVRPRRPTALAISRRLCSSLSTWARLPFRQIKPRRKAFVNGVCAGARAFIENFPLPSHGHEASGSRDHRLGIRKRQTVGRQIDQAA